MRFYQLDLRQVIQTMGARRLRALVDGLPPDSAFVRTLVAQHDPRGLPDPLAVMPGLDEDGTKPILPPPEPEERPGRRFMRGVIQIDREMRQRMEQRRTRRR